MNQNFSDKPFIQQAFPYFERIANQLGGHLVQIQNDKLTKTTKHAKRHFWLTDVCTCHGLLPSHSA